MKKLFDLCMIVCAVITTGMLGFMMAGELPFPQTLNTLLTIIIFCIAWGYIIVFMFGSEAYEE